MLLAKKISSLPDSASNTVATGIRQLRLLTPTLSSFGEEREKSFALSRRGTFE
jgi:hypothetical protein